MIASLREEEAHVPVYEIDPSLSQSPLERPLKGLDLGEVFDISWAMSHKKDKAPASDLSKGNLALARTMLEAIRIKDTAGLTRNPFTGRANYKLTDLEAARLATTDENTAQLVALILETREPAFLDWAHGVQDQRLPRVSSDVTEKTKP